MKPHTNVFGTTGTFTSPVSTNGFYATKSSRQFSHRKNFFDSNPNDKNTHYFFDNAEDVGPVGAHIFSEYDAKAQKKFKDYDLKKRSDRSNKKTDFFNVSLRNRGLQNESASKIIQRDFQQEITNQRLPKYISPHLEKVNMNWRKLERANSPMGKGHMQIRKLHKNYFNQLFNLGDEQKN